MPDRPECPRCGHRAQLETMDVLKDGTRLRRVQLRCLRASFKLSFGRGRKDERCKPSIVTEEPL